MPRPLYVVRHGADHLGVAQQYTKRPQDGLVFRIEQATTGAGRSLLLTPAEVVDLRNTLSDWLNDGHHGQRIADAITAHAEGKHPGIPDPVIPTSTAVQIARTTP